MNKILVEVSVGELLDKISILEIKKEKQEQKRINRINQKIRLKEERKRKLQEQEEQRLRKKNQRTSKVRLLIC